MTVILLPAATRQATKWRNGRGITREIAVSPPGAALEGFDWRVSMADLNGAAPFSIFHGVDRILTVVAGTLELRFAARGTMRLTPQDAPLAFAGDDGCVGEALGGGAIDLNVMVRRGVFSASVGRAAGAVAVASPLCLLVALSPSRATFGGQSWELAQYDALLLRDESGILDLTTDALLIGLKEAATP